MRTLLAAVIVFALGAAVLPSASASAAGTASYSAEPVSAAVAVAKTQTLALRGVSVAGAEFTSAGLPLFDKRESFTYLASRGYTVVRLPFLWESVQPQLSAPLSDAAVVKLTAAVADARAAGLRVILDVHNYAKYRGVAYGEAGSFTESDFTDLWRRLSDLFRADPTVVGYGLMNEPRALPAVEGVSGNQRWQHAQQAALTAVRANGDVTCVLVSGYTAGTMGGWLNATNGQPTPFITDPANNFRWEAHHYWDAGSTGKYMTSYAQAVAAGFGSAQGDAARTSVMFALNQWIDWLTKYGQKGFIGEFGWPSAENAQSAEDAASWDSLARLYLARVDQTPGDLLWTTAWATGTRWSNGYALQYYASTDGVLSTPLSSAAALEASARAAGAMPAVVPAPATGAGSTPAPSEAPTPTSAPAVAPTPTSAPADTPSAVPTCGCATPTEPAGTGPAAVVATVAPKTVVTKSAAAKTTLKVTVGRSGSRVKLTVRAGAKATGVIRVTVGKRTIATAKLKRGKATLVLARGLKIGKQTVVVRYAKAAAKRVSVTRRK